MELTLLIDFGSTYTKVTAVDLAAERVVASAKGPTTVQTDIMVGLDLALSSLEQQLGQKPVYGRRLACSSAAGGLSMVTIGLVPELTAEAAKRAALGAGAKVVKVYAYQLNSKEVSEIESITPDIVLLSGGTDGGNKSVITANASALASSKVKAPIVVAGNKAVQDEVTATLRGGGKDVRVTDNVMPEIGVLNVEKAREVIREVFIDHIVMAKGLKKAEEFVEGILMPTPTSVLNAAGLLARGTDSEAGIGEMMIVDIGGATTDVHTAARGTPTGSGVLLKGLPEPFLKRTVEGDIGMRYSVAGIIDAVGIESLAGSAGLPAEKVEAYLGKIGEDVSYLPQTPEEWSIEVCLAGAGVETAAVRHAGTLENVFTPLGEIAVQHGKDLREIPTVIGTGGVIVYNRRPREILQKALYGQERPFSLRPVQPRLYVDDLYLLYAIGLLAEVDRDKALRIGKKYLREL